MEMRLVVDLRKRIARLETRSNCSRAMIETNHTLVKQIFERARFIHSLGIELISFGDGWCESQINVTASLEQQHGLVHAGVLMTLADHTCEGAAATMAPEGQDVITVENKFHSCAPRLDVCFSVAPMSCRWKETRFRGGQGRNRAGRQQRNRREGVKHLDIHPLETSIVMSTKRGSPAPCILARPDRR